MLFVSLETCQCRPASSFLAGRDVTDTLREVQGRPRVPHLVKHRFYAYVIGRSPANFEEGMVVCPEKRTGRPLVRKHWENSSHPICSPRVDRHCVVRGSDLGPLSVFLWEQKHDPVSDCAGGRREQASAGEAQSL